MIVFPCQVCRTQLSAEAGQAGQLVRCPTCLTTLRVPAEQYAGTGAAAALAGMTSGGAVGALSSHLPRPGPGGIPGMSRPTGKRYGFNCGYCSSRLEATESMAAQEG